LILCGLRREISLGICSKNCPNIQFFFIKITIWEHILCTNPNILIIAHWLCNYFSIFLLSPITMLELPVQPQLNPINNDQHFTRLDLDAYNKSLKISILLRTAQARTWAAAFSSHRYHLKWDKLTSRKENERAAELASCKPT
jgi:hypothetical protein